MNRDEFLQQVQTLAGLPDVEMAEKGTRAVFEILSLRLTGGESADLLVHVPDDLKELWDLSTRYHDTLRHTREGQLDYRTIDELYDLVGGRLSRENVPGDADVIVAAVLRVLKSMLDTEQVQHVAAQLPEDVAHLWNAV